MKHENYSLGYDILKVHARLLHRLIYRRVTVLGLENIPKDKPIIFAPNHQNALMDAMAVLLTCPYQPTWLARADIFGNKFLNTVLHFLKMSPVYRIRDGKDNLGKNEEVFDLSIRVLKNNKPLALFPEGMHTFKRQSVAHKKAVPRIAFMAGERENFELDIQIVPVGLYYEHYYQHNRKMMIRFGKPIFLKDYADLYKKNPGAATIALRKELYAKLVSLTIHIQSKEYYDEYELLREIQHNDCKKELKMLEQFESDQAFIQQVENWEKENPEPAASLMSKTSEYKHLLDKESLTDNAVACKKSTGKTLLHAFLGGLSLPLFLYGFVNYFLGFYLPSVFVRKKIKDKAFWATVEYVLWIIFIPLFALIQFGLVWTFSKSLPWALAYLLTMPLFGKITLFLKDYYKQTFERIKVSKGGSAIDKMKELRNQIISTLGRIS